MVDTVKLETVPLVPTAAYPLQIIFQVTLAAGKPLMSCYASLAGVRVVVEDTKDEAIIHCGQVGSLSIPDVESLDPTFHAALVAFVASLNAMEKAI